MSDLIGREDAIKELDSIEDLDIYSEDDALATYWRGTARAQKKIIDMPTVDAEPVIRCCDCKHSWESLVPESVECEEMQRAVYAQGYCYKGERKQESDTE